jgi:hypothetical protein
MSHIFKALGVPKHRFKFKFSLSMSIYNPWALTVYCLTFVCVFAWKVKQKTSLADLPGPPPESFLLGRNYPILPSSIISGLGGSELNHTHRKSSPADEGASGRL